MHVNASIAAALQRVDERAADVLRAYTPGARPALDDVTRTETSYPTLDPLSVAPPERAYFVTRGADGATRYTRSGTFSVRGGILTAQSGDAVLGADARGTLGTLRVNAVDVELGRARNVRIDTRGEMIYERDVVNPRSGLRERRRVVAGRLALARFPAGTRLSGNGETLDAPPGSSPHYGVPGDGNFAPLETMRRESSGVDIDRSLDRLRVAYREIEAMESAYRAQDAAKKTAMEIVK